MAATITKVQKHPNRLTVDRPVFMVFGTGAPADSDVLVTQVKTYPTGIFYVDTQNKKAYIRVGETPDADDFVEITVTA